MKDTFTPIARIDRAWPTPDAIFLAFDSVRLRSKHRKIVIDITSKTAASIRFSQ